MRTVLGSFGLFGLIVSMVGCGGSSNNPFPGTPTPVHFSIAWAERSRAIQGPSSALSATVSLVGAGVHGGTVSTSVDRNAAPAGYTGTYTSTDSARTGTYAVNVQFYDHAGGTGTVVATANANVTITADGSGIGNVSVTNKIVAVNVTPGQTVPFNSQVQLTFTALDGADGMVAVSPGSATWTKVDGNALTLTADGMATGTGVGTSNVQVAVDGATSSATAVTVPAPPDFQDSGFQTLSVPANTWTTGSEITGIPWTGSSSWGIANLSGAWGTAGHDSSTQYAYIQAANNSNPVSQGILKQTITGLTVGAHYRVSLWIARRNGNVGGNVGALITVLANGVSIMPDTSPLGNGAWGKVTTSTFTATATSYEFQIKSVLPEFTDDESTLVDDVHLEIAP